MRSAEEEAERFLYHGHPHFHHVDFDPMGGRDEFKRALAALLAAREAEVRDECAKIVEAEFAERRFIRKASGAPGELGDIWITLGGQEELAAAIRAGESGK